MKLRHGHLSTCRLHTYTSDNHIPKMSLYINECRMDVEYKKNVYLGYVGSDQDQFFNSYKTHRHVYALIPFIQNKTS